VVEERACDDAQAGIAQQDEGNKKVIGKHSRAPSGDSESATNSVTGTVTLEKGKIRQAKKQRTHGGGNTASELRQGSDGDSEHEANDYDEKVNKIKGQ
jgi:hypothetical protein